MVCYLDNTVALPLVTAYAHARHPKRPLKRLYERREAMLQALVDEFNAASDEPVAVEHAHTMLPQHR